MSYTRNYALTPSQDEPPLSAREGKTLKEHVELLHMVVAHNTETVDRLSKKVKVLEKSIEPETESDEEAGVVNDKKEDTINRFSSLFLRASTIAAMALGVGFYVVTAISNKSNQTNQKR